MSTTIFDPNPQLTDAMRSYRREGAKLAAMILLAEPSRVGDETIFEFLMRIEYLRRKTALALLRAARIDPMLTRGELTSVQRLRLVGALSRYAKGER
jgi:hypothetical protein